jgi:hypothetical protein
VAAANNQGARAAAVAPPLRRTQLPVMGAVMVMAAMAVMATATMAVARQRLFTATAGDGDGNNSGGRGSWRHTLLYT